MSYLTDPQFWAATGERAVSTAAQAALGAVGATALVHEVQWVIVGSTAGLAAVLAVLKAIAAGAATGTPSATGAEQLPDMAVLHDGTLYDPQHD